MAKRTTVRTGLVNAITAFMVEQAKSRGIEVSEQTMRQRISTNLTPANGDTISVALEKCLIGRDTKVIDAKIAKLEAKLASLKARKR